MTRKTVLITGAAHRIGAAIAQRLHAADMNIIVHYNSSETAANKLVETLNKKRTDSACSIKADLAHIDELPELVNTAIDFQNRLDVLVNNASQFFPTSMGDTTEEQWEKLISTNMKAPYFLAQACVPSLRETRGCIINITDIHGIKPLKNYSIYSAAKAGLLMLNQAMAKELGPDIRVNAISPGAILWPDGMNDQQKKNILNKTVLGRAGAPIDIANAVYFLINDADYMTGQTLNIDGGRSLS